MLWAVVRAPPFQTPVSWDSSLLIIYSDNPKIDDPPPTPDNSSMLSPVNSSFYLEPVLPIWLGFASMRVPVSTPDFVSLAKIATGAFAVWINSQPQGEEYFTLPYTSPQADGTKEISFRNGPMARIKGTFPIQCLNTSLMPCTTSHPNICYLCDVTIFVEVGMSALNGSYNFNYVCLPAALDNFLGVNPSEIDPQNNTPPIISAGSNA